MDRLGDRLKLIHQKDFSKTSDSPINLWTVNDPNVLVTWDSFGKGSDHKDFCEIGTGIMDIQSIINKGNELGAEYIVLEQDHTQLTQMESVRISMDSFHKFSGLDW
jgi:sugar phosphate isomerase/epimerase